MSDHLYYRSLDPAHTEIFKGHFAACDKWSKRMRAIKFPHPGFKVECFDVGGAFGSGTRRVAAVVFDSSRQPVPPGWREIKHSQIVPRKTKDADARAARAWSEEHLHDGPHINDLFDAIGVRSGFFDDKKWISAHTGYGLLCGELWVVLPDWAPEEERPGDGWKLEKTSAYWLAREKGEAA